MEEEGVEETKQDKVESQRDLTPAFMAQCVLPVCIQREKKPNVSCTSDHHKEEEEEEEGREP